MVFPITAITRSRAITAIVDATEILCRRVTAWSIQQSWWRGCGLRFPSCPQVFFRVLCFEILVLISLLIFLRGSPCLRASVVTLCFWLWPRYTVSSVVKGG